MQFGIDECAQLIMKIGWEINFDDTKLPQVNSISSLRNNEGYKHHRVLQDDKLMEGEMRGKISKEIEMKLRKVHSK